MKKEFNSFFCHYYLLPNIFFFLCLFQHFLVRYCSFIGNAREIQEIQCPYVLHISFSRFIYVSRLREVCGTKQCACLLTCQNRQDLNCARAWRPLAPAQQFVLLKYLSQLKYNQRQFHKHIFLILKNIQFFIDVLFQFVHLAIQNL